jgi:hypothetical protein
MTRSNDMMVMTVNEDLNTYNVLTEETDWAGKEKKATEKLAGFKSAYKKSKEASGKEGFGNKIKNVFRWIANKYRGARAGLLKRKIAKYQSKQQAPADETDTQESVIRLCTSDLCESVYTPCNCLESAEACDLIG